MHIMQLTEYKMLDIHIWLWLCLPEDDTESGLTDEDLEHSKHTLVSVAAAYECDCTFLRERMANKGKVHEFLIRKQYGETDFLEVKWVMCSLYQV